jgi:hypothetical protein
MGAESANYPVKRMAGLWGVSRSGFYAWRARRLSKSSTRARVQAELDAKVRLARADSTGTYGAPRIHADLSRNGTGVDRKTVAASMRRHGLEGSPRGGSARSRRSVRNASIRSRIWWQGSGIPALGWRLRLRSWIGTTSAPG